MRTSMMEAMTNNESTFEERVQYLKQNTGIINETAIGCYLSNYNDRYICGRFHNSGCKQLMACQLLDKANKVEE